MRTLLAWWQWVLVALPATVALVGIVLILAACGGGELDGGQVVGKVHEAAQESTTTIYQQVGNVLVPIVITDYDDEDWRLDLVDEQGREGHAYVTRERYAAIEVGDWFSRADDEATTDGRTREPVG